MKDIIGRKIAQSSFVFSVLCIGLLWVAKISINNQDFLRAYVLVFTSNIITVAYFFGLRGYVKKLQKGNN